MADSTDPTSRPISRRITFMEFSFWRWLISSVDLQFYKKLPFMHSRTGIIYIIIVFLFTSILLSVQTTWKTLGIIARFTAEYDRHFPPIAFHDFKLDADIQEPASFIVQGFQIVLDPENRMEALDPLVKDGVILKRDQMLVLISKETPRQIRYSSLGLTDMEIDKESLTSLQPVLAGTVLTISLFIRLLSSGLTKTIEILMASILSGIIADAFRVRLLPYQRINIAVTAIVPPIVLETISEFLGMGYGGFFIFYIIVYGLFVSMGTVAIVHKSTPAA